jgi:hypothetical protein
MIFEGKKGVVYGTRAAKKYPHTIITSPFFMDLKIIRVVSYKYGRGT